MLQAFPGSLAGHFHQPQVGHFGNAGFSMVFFQSFFKSPQDLASMLGIFHINKINNNNTTKITQPELSNNSLGSFKIGFEYGFFKIAIADITAGIDIYRRHGLSLINNQVAAGFQLNFGLQCFLNFIFYPVKIKDRPFTRVIFNSRCQFRNKLIGKLNHLIIGFSGINTNGINITVRNIAHDFHGQGQVFINQRTNGDRFTVFLNGAPQLLQKSHIRMYRIF